MQLYKLEGGHLGGLRVELGYKWNAEAMINKVLHLTMEDGNGVGLTCKRPRRVLGSPHFGPSQPRNSLTDFDKICNGIVVA